MAVMDSTSGEQDIMRIWSLLTEVSEQLTQSRSISITVHSLTSGVKSQAIHSQTGFVLRRFNLDKPKDVYEAELEKMNFAMSAENQSLQNDNRQLNALIREYEQTLENVMSQFRAHAYEVQQRELALLREYESAIVQRETEALEAALVDSNTRSQSLARVGRMLRVVMRKLNGEDMNTCETAMAAASSSTSPSNFQTQIPTSTQTVAQPSECQPCDSVTEGASEDKPIELGDDLGDDGDDFEKLQRRITSAEWALERESELARLERENEELRQLLQGVLNAETSPLPAMPAPRRAVVDQLADISEDGRASPTPSVASTTSTATVRQPGKRLGGPPGTVGPFGSYRSRAQLGP